MKLIVGNWKSNPNTIATAEKLALAEDYEGVVIVPPFQYLERVKSQLKNALLGAQDVFWEKSGAFTGEISAEQLRDSAVEYVIVGHSERRALGEDAHEVARKLEVILDSQMIPILCVGEKNRDEEGEYFHFVQEEIESALANVSHTNIKKIIIAYEPIWAIGKGNESISTHDMHEMSIFIKKTLIPLFGKKLASGVSILYGGSVDRNNTEALIKEGEINGFLVGRASLDANHFKDIISIVEKI